MSTQQHPQQPPPQQQHVDQVRTLLLLAYEISCQNWINLSHDEQNVATCATNDSSMIIERLSALMMIRCLTLVLCCTDHHPTMNQGTAIDDTNNTPPTTTSSSTKRTQTIFKDLSTSTIAYQLLSHQVLFPYHIITSIVLKEIIDFVRCITSGYQDSVPYHNKEHAYHVVISANKLMDMMLTNQNTITPHVFDTTTTASDGNHGPDDPSTTTMNGGTSTTPHATTTTTTTPGPKRIPYYCVTYGLRHDPIALFALLFASLIHDVEHQGIPNRQLAIENDRLAVLYNDQSMAENYSLYVAFSELLNDNFIHLHKIIVQQGHTVTNEDSISDYRRFRKLVIDLVLSTDIASPERTQINKSKWKEAFGDPYETVERKLKLASLQQQNQHIPASKRFSLTGRHITAPKRLSMMSGVSAMSYNPNDDMMYTEDDGYDDSLSATPDVSESEMDSYEASTTRNNNSTANTNSPIKSCSSGGGNLMPFRSPESNMAVAPGRRSSVDHSGMMNYQTPSSFMNMSVGMDAPSGRNFAAQQRRGSLQFMQAKFDRRLSATSVSNHSLNHGTGNTQKYRQRLGILRTVDLSGETIETYSRTNSIRTLNSTVPNGNNTTTTNVSTTASGIGAMHLTQPTSTNLNNNTILTKSTHVPFRKESQSISTNNSNDTEPTSHKNKSNENSDTSPPKKVVSTTNGNVVNSSSTSLNVTNHAWCPLTQYEADEPDELKASVVLETFMVAADVAHNLQSWEHMVKWSSRLYVELRRAYMMQRSTIDPSCNWYENQIGFLESYLLPVARRLEDTCVFDEYSIGQLFSTTVENNRDKWLVDGVDVTKNSITEGNTKFPMTSTR